MQILCVMQCIHIYIYIYTCILRLESLRASNICAEHADSACMSSVNQTNTYVETKPGHMDTIMDARRASAYVHVHGHHHGNLIRIFAIRNQILVSV